MTTPDPMDAPGYQDGWNAAHYALWQWRPGEHDGACECPECVTIRHIIQRILRYDPEAPDDHPRPDLPDHYRPGRHH